LTEPIQGKVAAVLTEYEVALNIGSDDKVAEGMKFEVLSGPVPICDPDSGDEIGKVSLTAGRVKVYEVHPKYSLARTYESESAFPPFPSLLRPLPSLKKLPVDKTDVLVAREGIKKGNLVRQIVE